MSIKISNLTNNQVRNFVQQVESKIFNVKNLYERKPTLFLTESDENYTPENESPLLGVKTTKI